MNRTPQDQWVILPLNLKRSKWLTVVGLVVGFFTSWVVAVSLRATWIFWIADKDTPFNRFPIMAALFLPEFVFLGIWVWFREIWLHISELLKSYLVQDQIELAPVMQHIPHGKFHVPARQILKGAFLSGFTRCGKILLVPIVFMVGLYLLFSPDGGGRPYQEFALTQSLMPEPANSYFFPDPVQSIVADQAISAKGRCLGEAAFMGQLLGLVFFAVFRYWAFARGELNDEYAARVSRSRSSFFPLGDTRGGGMTRED